MKSFKLLLLLAITLPFLSTQAQEKAKLPNAEKQYIVHERARQITRLDIRKNNKAKENVVQIETQSVTGGSATLLKGDVPTVEITTMEAVVGSFGRRNEVLRTGRSVVLRLSDVVYPLRLRLTFSDRPVLEVEFKEPGTWFMVAGITL